MIIDLRQLFENIDSRIASRPESTVQSLAQEFGTTVHDIESAVREIDGVSFDEYRLSKLLAHALKILEEQQSSAGSRIYQEERAQPRLTITGATIRYLPLGGDICKSEFSNPYPIVDLNTAGMAFLADRPAKPGRKVGLLANFSGEKKPLRLEGRVVYAVAVDIAAPRYRLGIRFQAFAAKEGCNPPQAFEELAQVMKEAAP